MSYTTYRTDYIPIVARYVPIRRQIMVHGEPKEWTPVYQSGGWAVQKGKKFYIAIADEIALYISFELARSQAKRLNAIHYE